MLFLDNSVEGTCIQRNMVIWSLYFRFLGEKWPKIVKNAFFLIDFAKNVKNGIENKHFFADITKLSWSEEMSFMYVLYLRGRGCERQKMAKNGQKWLFLSYRKKNQNCLKTLTLGDYYG